jgi:hypothetical protein
VKLRFHSSRPTVEAKVICSKRPYSAPHRHLPAFVQPCCTPPAAPYPTPHASPSFVLLPSTPILQIQTNDSNALRVCLLPRMAVEPVVADLAKLSAGRDYSSARSSRTARRSCPVMVSPRPLARRRGAPALSPVTIRSSSLLNIAYATAHSHGHFCHRPGPSSGKARPAPSRRTRKRCECHSDASASCPPEEDRGVSRQPGG